MADDNATQGVPASSAAPAPVAAAPAVPEAIEISPEAAAAGFTKDDFSHPEYGGKTKNLYKGFQSASQRAKDAERQFNDYKTQWQTFLQTDPAFKKAVAEYKARSEGTAQNSDNAPNDGAEAPADPQSIVDAKLALQGFYSHLGQGDPMKGAQVFKDQWEGDINSFFNTAWNGSPQDQLRLAHEFLTLKRGLSQKTNTSPPPPPPGDTGAETGRGAATGTSQKPTNPWDIAAQQVLGKASWEDVTSGRI